MGMRGRRARQHSAEVSKRSLEVSHQETLLGPWPQFPQDRTWWLMDRIAKETAGPDRVAWMVGGKTDVTVKGPGAEDTKKPGQEETKGKAGGPGHLSVCPGRREAHNRGRGSATPTGTSGRPASQLGPLPIQRVTEPRGWLLPGREAFSWERGSLLRGPLNWGKRVREGAVWASPSEGDSGIIIKMCLRDSKQVGWGWC